MNLKILLGSFILTLPVTGCITEYNAELPANDEQILVVEGNIVGNTDATFYLSKSFPLNSTSVPSESLDIDANLTVIGSDGYKSPPATSLGKGAYQISIGELSDDVEYGLQIEYDGNTYQSTLSKPLQTPEIDSVSWVQPEKAGAISFRVSTHDDTEGAKFFIWNYVENWEISAYYYTTIFYNPVDSLFYLDSAAPSFYCWKSNKSSSILVGSTESLNENKIINQQLYQGAPEDDRFSMLYCATVYQTAISKNAFDFYQNRKLLNEEMGGLFTPQPSELRGNIICITESSKKAMGYVEVVKNTTLKRTFVNWRQITRPPVYSLNNCTTITKDSVQSYMNQNNINSYGDFYRLGYRPISMDLFGYPEILPDEWASKPCADCVANGGSKNKPDFWPNNDQ